jgi:hypothetical protein
MYAPVWTGLGLLITLPALAAERPKPAVDCRPVIKCPAPLPQDYFKKTILVEIKGKLVEVWASDPWLEYAKRDPRPPRFPMPRPPIRYKYKVWQITANGQTYHLDWNGNSQLAKLAEKLKGKSVRLIGRGDSLWQYPLVEPAGKGNATWEICRLWPVRPTVSVTHMEADEGEYVRETVQVVLRGKLDLNASFGYPVAVKAPAIYVKGKWYVLDFGTSLDLHQLARKLDGKTVVLEGTFGGMRQFPGMCRRDSYRYQVINVTRLLAGDGDSVHKLNTVAIKGKLVINDKVRACLYEDEPDYRVTVNGGTYGLDFGDNKAFLDLAAKLKGKTVVLTGTLEKRRLFAGQLWTFVIVSDLKADVDYVRQSESVEIRGQLVFPPLPDCVGYEGLSCLISVNGEAYWLDFGGNKKLAELARRLKGKSVVVEGTLGKRNGRGPVRVFVTRLSEPVVTAILVPKTA